MKPRDEMLDRHLVARGIRDWGVISAMRRIPREFFVGPDDEWQAYTDAPIGIGFGQTISQPYMTALMCQELKLRGDEIVLDVGTGSGYHAAVLGALARQVYSIEVIPELAEQARRNLDRSGLGGNIFVLDGDGSRGMPEFAPYDAITVGAGAPDVPQALMDQLRDPGRLVIPVGTREDQDLRVITLRDGCWESTVATGCRFVPLVGEQGWR